MKIKQALLSAKKELRGLQVAEPESSAEFLLAHSLGLTRSELYANLEAEVPLKSFNKFQKYLSKRKKHEPVWQITGSVPFWGMELRVNKNVLVPRPETEFLVQEVLKIINKNNFKKNDCKLKILDVGTGAGPITCSIAKTLKADKELSLNDFELYASDISTKALGVAKKNAKANGLEKIIKFKQSDLLRGWKGQKFDIVCANLPYIPHEEMPTLAIDVHHWEPRLALDGGRAGLEIYEEFFHQLPNCISEKAVVLCEIGENQGRMIEKIIKKYFLKTQIKVKQDLAGIDRIVIVEIDKKGVL